MRSGENSSARLPSSRWREYAESEIGKAALIPIGKGPWSPSKPSRLTIERAYALIKAIKRDDLLLPITSTGPDGVLCLEWRQQDRKLIFSVFEDGLIEFYLSAPRTEGEIRDDRLEIANQVVESFLQRR